METYDIRIANVKDSLILEEILDREEKNFIDMFYNYPNLVRTIEGSCMAFTILDEQNMIKGLVIFDYEPINASHLTDDCYQLLASIDPNLRSFNSIFLSFLLIKAADAEEYKTIFDKIALKVFAENCNIDNIVFLDEKNDINEDTERRTSLREFLGNRKIWESCGIFKIFRKTQVVPTLKFRKAREEDQDDLSIVCNSQTNLTTTTFGNFFLAEMISSEKDDTLCLVAENDDKKAIGMAVVSSDLNYNVLVSNFDLTEHNYCIKSDFYEAYQHHQNQLEQVRQIQAQHRAQQNKEELSFFKTICSKNWLMLEIQEYCWANKAAFLNEFQPILNDVEKQKMLNKSILKRKLDKLLKAHKISTPNEIFGKELDHEIFTCTMSATDLLLETLRMFDLPANYLDGEGHWSFWLKRKQDEKNEEARQKDILGKKKIKNKKNKFIDNKENQLSTPQWFDIEPFYVAFQNFVSSQSSIRKKVCELITNNKEYLLPLFCAENGELINGRVVDISDMIESLASKIEGAIDENFQQIMTYVLLCFGKLEYDSEVVTLREQLKAKSGKTKDKNSQRTLRKISYNELMHAVKYIMSSEDILSKRHDYLEYIAHSNNQKFKEETEKFIRSNRREFETSTYFNSEFAFSLFQEVSSENVLQSVPKDLKNAVCWTIFFIDKFYEENSNEFLFHIFEHFQDREYLLITLPHNTPQFKLLENFIYVRPKSDSNFSHSLYILHKANLMNNLAIVELVSTKETKSCYHSVKDFVNEQQMTQMEFQVCLRIGDSNDMLIGSLKAVKSMNMPFIKQNYGFSEIGCCEAFNKNEVLEVKSLELHYLFKPIERFVLREALRLSKCRILIKDQKNANLIGISRHFFAVKHLSSPLLIRKDDIKEHQIQTGDGLYYYTNTWNFEKIANEHKMPKPIELSVTIPKYLSLKRQRVDARIVVVGASSCALSFIESLLNHPSFCFSSIFLISENFDWEPHVIETKAQKIEHIHNSFCIEALLKRVCIASGKMIFLDRKTNRISIRTFSSKEFQLEYDYLIFANSLEEKTYENLSEKKSQGELLKRPKLMFAVDKLNTDLCESLCSNNKLPLFVDINQQFILKEMQSENLKNFTKSTHEYREVRELITTEENILNMFRGRKNWFERITQMVYPMQIVLYGFSIEILIVMEQLINRWKVCPSNITLVLPRKMELLDKEEMENSFLSFEKRLEFFEKLTETPSGVNQSAVREFYLEKLTSKGICVLKDYEISDFSYSENSVTLKTIHPTAKDKGNNVSKKKPSRFSTNLNISKNFDKNMMSNVPGQMFNSNLLNVHANESQNENPEGEEIVFENCLFITGDFYDISHQTFRTIQENGLVYNGRLIVQSNFQTIDNKIFGAGKICEFSQRYKGLALGRSLRMDKYNQKEIGQKLAQCFIAHISGLTQDEELPSFYQPTGMLAFLPFGYSTVEVDTPFQGKPDYENSITYEHNNLLNEPEEEYVSLGFDSFGILKRFFYFGRKTLQMEAVNNLIGLHKNYFNNFFKHNQSGLVKSFIDFMNEDWAKALFHPSFPMFKQLMLKFALGERQDCSLDICASESVKLMIEDGLMDFVMEYKDLLQYYYVPDFKTRLE